MNVEGAYILIGVILTYYFVDKLRNGILSRVNDYWVMINSYNHITNTQLLRL